MKQIKMNLVFKAGFAIFFISIFGCSKSNGGAAAGDPLSSSLAGLSSCGSGSLFTQNPVDMSQVIYINPIGQTGTAHVVPSDHNNVFLTTSSGLTSSTNLTAPGSLRIIQLNRHHETGATTFDLYKVSFSPCLETEFYFDHLTSLSAVLLTAMTSNATYSCNTYSSNGYQIQDCGSYVSIDLSAGDLIGAVGGSPNGVTSQNQIGFDFGGYDGRLTASIFANASKWTASSFKFDEFHVACPFDYFGSSQKSAFYALLGYGSYPAAGGSCGTVAVDVAGTAQGDWYDTTAANIADQSYGLSMILSPLSGDPQTGLIGGQITVGQSLPSVLGRYTFVRANSGTVNRDFSAITEDGTIYCFDHLYLNGGTTTGILIAEIMGGKLKFESQSGGASQDCTNGGSALAFTASAHLYQR